MDSGNSGSIQSSSGGDDEYDSRADSISPFMNPTTHVGPISPPPPPLHPMFDSVPTYFHHMSQQPISNQNSFLNLDMVWSKTTQPNGSEINPLLPSSSSVQQQQPFFGSHGQQSLVVPFTTTNHHPSPPSTVSFPTSKQTQVVVRNPKKRSRASRRAPTTVLTTDTTNFRAMVQEFTGIPPPPFTSSTFPRTRLDLFGTPSSIRSNLSLDSSSQPTTYLLRPFAQKLQPPPPPPFLSSSSSLLGSSLVDPTVCTTSTNNPILTFQSLLHNQAPPKYQRTQVSSEILSPNDSHLKMGGLDELGLSHGHVNNPTLTGLPNLVSFDRTASRNYNNPAPTWGDSHGSNDGDDQSFVNGSFINSSGDVKNGKLNYSPSSSNFNGDKGSENVSTRGEGMMQEPWLCSSD